MQRERTRYPAQYGLFLIAYHASNAIYQSYISVYYTALNFSSSQIGAIFAAVAFVSIFSQPMWGLCGDRVPSRNRLIRLLALASAASIASFLLTERYGALLLLACVFSCFYTAIQPMGDSIILDALNRQNQPFGPIRLAAGVCFACAALGFGFLMNPPGRDRWVIYFVAALCLLIIPSTCALPQMPGYQAQGRRMSLRELFRNRELVLLMLFMLPLQLTLGYFYVFFSPHFLTLKGSSGSLLGWCYFISAMSEVPYLLHSDRLFEKLGCGKLMCISASVLTLRWIVLGLTRNVAVAMASQLLHGWGFVVMTVSTSKYISRNVPQELQASGQMLLGVVSFGVARVAGSLGGGILADALGRQNVFFINAAICLIALIAFAPRYLRRGRAQV